MASDINKVVLIGRLVRDPELKYTPSGTPVSNFSIANNRSYSVSGEKKDQVSYFNCIAWSRLGELMVQYCKKGHRIAVEGRLQQRSWDDQGGNKRSVVEIVVENFQFLTPKGTAGEGAFPQDVGADLNEMNEAGNNPFSDDDIPF